MNAAALVSALSRGIHRALGLSLLVFPPLTDRDFVPGYGFPGAVLLALFVGVGIAVPARRLVPYTATCLLVVYILTIGLQAARP